MFLAASMDLSDRSCRLLEADGLAPRRSLSEERSVVKGNS